MPFVRKTPCFQNLTAYNEIKMSVVYRKHIRRLNGEWHFRRDCSFWPETAFIEIGLPPVNVFLCTECIKLEAQAESN